MLVIMRDVQSLIKKHGGPNAILSLSLLLSLLAIQLYKFQNVDVM